MENPTEKKTFAWFCRYRVPMALIMGAGVGWAMVPSLGLGVGIAIGAGIAIAMMQRGREG